LVDGWAPAAMIVSFKLETDPSILVEKARYALKRYSHHLVIGNLLETRKWEVVFVSAADGEHWIRLSKQKTDGITDENGTSGLSETSQDEPVVEIESLIIPEVAKLHDIFIANHVEKK